MAELPDRLAVRLRWFGRVLAALSLLIGGAFVVLARRSAGTSDAATLASGLFWGAAVLQFGLALVLLSRRRRR